jgi:hypothetical protein
MTAYGIAKLLQTLNNPDTKRCHSFITTKTLNYIWFVVLGDRIPINEYKHQT